MRPRIARWISIALFVGGSIGTASANTTSRWTLSGGGVSGSGLLTTGAPDGGGYDILSFDGAIDGSPVALYGGQPGPIRTLGPDNIFYDNILYPSLNAGSPVCAGVPGLVDLCGIDFTLNNGYGNIYANYSGVGSSLYEFTFDLPFISYNYFPEFSVTPYAPTPIPEPEVLILLATGITAIGLIKRKEPSVAQRSPSLGLAHFFRRERRGQANKGVAPRLNVVKGSTMSPFRWGFV